MASTKEQIYKRLISFVPSWWHQGKEESIAVAHFMGIAAVFEKLELELDNHLSQTFICEATGAYLNEHGSERNLERRTGEINASFANRIKNIINTTSCPEIKRVVDALLQVGESVIQEDTENALFLDRESFLNRGEILIDPVEPAFSIIVDNQVHDPLSFYDREYFLNREDFMGQQNSSLELFQLVVDTVNKNKACGVRYRLIERAG